MVYVRRGDAEGAARAHRALSALAEATGDEGVRRARVLVAFSALCGHLRAGRVDLAVDAHDDVAGVRSGDERDRPVGQVRQRADQRLRRHQLRRSAGVGHAGRAGAALAAVPCRAPVTRSTTRPVTSRGSTRSSRDTA